MDEIKELYVSPQIEVVEVAVEYGMEMSDTTVGKPGGYELGEWD